MINNLFDGIQKNIENLYDINLGINVSDFLIDENKLSESADWKEFFSQLSADSSEDIELTINGAAVINNTYSNTLKRYRDAWFGLYLSDNLLQTLNKNDPRESINNTNSNAFMTAIEEVSYLIYAMQAVKYDKQFTKLEQEMQASVDQFLITYFHIKDLNKGLVPLNMIDYFTNPETYVYPYMCKEYIERYKLAAKTSAKYNKFLFKEHLMDLQKNPFKKEVIDFYNKTQMGKLERVREIRKI